jgi:hypothetical protein
MEDNTLENDLTNQKLLSLLKFIDGATFNKIINKLTVYAEILTIGKLSGIVNYNYRLNSEETSEIINLLLDLQALCKIHNLAFKGTKDLEDEFISNIFSDVTAPSNISSFISIRNLLENRLTHQIQQYNINMGKSNTTLAMPLNELRGHAKTYRSLREDNLAISTKAQHGIIAASLHDAYVTMIAKPDWSNDRTYMKFFFNEDDPLKRKTLILSNRDRLNLVDINTGVQEAIQRMTDLKMARMMEEEDDRERSADFERVSHAKAEPKAYVDKMLMTPFGRQYGQKIDAIIGAIYGNRSPDFDEGEDDIAALIRALYNQHETDPASFSLMARPEDVSRAMGHLIHEDMSLRLFAEKFLYEDHRETFNKFYSENRKKNVEEFIFAISVIYFEEQFRSLFNFIKSGELKKFACAYIIKRIYLRHGEGMTRFGYYLIRAIARVGGIKGQ